MFECLFYGRLYWSRSLLAKSCKQRVPVGESSWREWVLSASSCWQHCWPAFWLQYSFLGRLSFRLFCFDVIRFPVQCFRKQRDAQHINWSMVWIDILALDWLQYSRRTCTNDRFSVWLVHVRIWTCTERAFIEYVIHRTHWFSWALSAPSQSLSTWLHIVYAAHVSAPALSCMRRWAVAHQCSVSILVIHFIVASWSGMQDASSNACCRNPNQEWCSLMRFWSVYGACVPADQSSVCRILI